MKNLSSFLFITAFALCFMSPNLKAQQTIELFNGKNLDNWVLVVENENTLKANEVFTVKEGVIHVKGYPFGYMHTKDKYDNFRLHVEWCYPIEKSNSGIFLFVQEPDKVWPNAIECQLCAGKAGDLVLLGGSDLKEFQLKQGEKRPDFPIIVKKNASTELGIGEWNNADIICENGNITVFINGTLQNKGTKEKNKSGYIALQSEGSDILFRNIKLTPLK